MRRFWVVLLICFSACTAVQELPANTRTPPPAPTLPAGGIPTTERPATPGARSIQSTQAAAPTRTLIPVITITPPPDQVGAATTIEEVTVPAVDGLTISGTFYPGSGSPPWPGLLLLHMVNSNRQAWGDLASQLAGQGYAVLAIDLRGHGKTGGTQDWEKAAHDVQRIWEYLAARTDVDARRTAIVGGSIGSNLALVAGAVQSSIRAVALLSPGLDYYGVRTEEAIDAYGKRPVFIAAAEADTYSAESAEKLAEAAQGEAQLQLYEDSSHGTDLLRRHPELAQLILDWLDRHVKSLEASAAGMQQLPERITDARGVLMVLVPAGSFEMGGTAEAALAACEELYIDGDCAGDWYQAEGPVHVVKLDRFYIDQLEVTNARYAACVAKGVCRPPSQPGSLTRSDYYANPQYADYPVVWVTWEDAQTYCSWRGGRLPTEAEWEKAARGIDGRIYPWGNLFDGSRVNSCDKNCIYPWANGAFDDGYADTAPAGSILSGASPYGVLDMAGNVGEWVADFFAPDYYSRSPFENPPGPAASESSDESRVVRGGSFHASGNSVRTTARHLSEPTGAYIGFRCAAPPSNP